MFSLIRIIFILRSTVEDNNNIKETDIANVTSNDDLNKINYNLEIIKSSLDDVKSGNNFTFSSSNEKSVDYENNKPSTSSDIKTNILLAKPDHDELNTIDNMTENNIKVSADGNSETNEEDNLSDTPLQSCSQRSSKYQNRNYRSQIDTSNSFSDDEEDLDSTQPDSVVPRNEDNDNDDNDDDEDANSNSDVIKKNY